ncbi:hypothetical protein [Pelagicoccus sp. SDUM812005]|uniref:hypothetical protein n=1 Tax=Pelagicoccus sp. SDUM812005 TaxID=3041257 RepID=UPI00280ED481|nr:hypothetical protein [Pelagicoccus sp. SDUM812005]MDQ8183462.1 hypothetical protein [Pelagicoccus sp. SDUM812005]
MLSFRGASPGAARLPAQQAASEALFKRFRLQDLGFNIAPSSLDPLPGDDPTPSARTEASSRKKGIIKLLAARRLDPRPAQEAASEALFKRFRLQDLGFNIAPSSLDPLRGDDPTPSARTEASSRKKGILKLLAGRRPDPRPAQQGSSEALFKRFRLQDLGFNIAPSSLDPLRGSDPTPSARTEANMFMKGAAVCSNCSDAVRLRLVGLPLAARRIAGARSTGNIRHAASGSPTRCVRFSRIEAGVSLNV